jgi:hypothetical protein
MKPLQRELSIPPSPVAPRRLTQHPLPPYRYVPGRHPHPTRSDDGHSAGGTLADELDEAEAFRYGVDLFNARYYWEAHEAWERVWRAQPPDGRGAMVLKGLIQLAAALFKVHVRAEEGARRLALRAVEHLETASRLHPSWRGLDLSTTAQLARDNLVLADAPLTVEGSAFEIVPH